MDIIQVRIGKPPGEIREFALDQESRQVGVALRLAELDPTGYDIRVNRRPATLGDILQEGDVVLLIRRVEGN